MNRQTILGSSGVIGTQLANALAAYTNTIRLVSRQPRAVNDTDELLAADLTDGHQVDRAVVGSAVVYVTIGFPYSTRDWERLWLPFIEAVINACARYQAKLVFFNNNYLYADQTMGDQTEASAIAPSSRKGHVRTAVAQLVSSAIRCGRVSGLIARSADFYGPNIVQRNLLMENVYENLKKGKPANWFIDADRVHTFTYTADAARATAQLGNTADAYGQVWHLPTTTERLTGRDWATLFAHEMGQPNKLSVLPVWMLRLLGLFIPFLREVRELTFMWKQDYVFRSDKFERRFGWPATSPQQAVPQTIALNSQKAVSLF